MMKWKVLLLGTVLMTQAGYADRIMPVMCTDSNGKQIEMHWPTEKLSYQQLDSGQEKQICLKHLYNTNKKKPYLNLSIKRDHKWQSLQCDRQAFVEALEKTKPLGCVVASRENNPSEIEFEIANQQYKIRATFMKTTRVFNTPSPTPVNLNEKQISNASQGSHPQY